MAVVPPPPGGADPRRDLEPVRGVAPGEARPKPTVAEAKLRLRAIAEREASDSAARVVRITVGAGLALGVIGLGALVLTLKAAPALLRWSTRGLGRRALQVASRPFRG